MPNRSNRRPATGYPTWKYKSRLERMMIKGELGKAINTLYDTIPITYKDYRKIALLLGRYNAAISEKQEGAELSGEMMEHLQESMANILTNVLKNYPDTITLRQINKKPLIEIDPKLWTPNSDFGRQTDSERRPTAIKSTPTSSGGGGCVLTALVLLVITCLGYFAYEGFPEIAWPF